jgi:hypothetical protein
MTPVEKRAHERERAEFERQHAPHVKLITREEATAKREQRAAIREMYKGKRVPRKPRQR